MTRSLRDRSQVPRPPILIGAWSDVGIQRAARLADGWIADPIRTVADVEMMSRRYRALEPGGAGTVVLMREAWVDEDRNPLDRFLPVIEPVFRYYRRWGAAELPEGFVNLAEDRFIVGTAEACAQEAFTMAERADADVVVLALRHPGGPDHEHTVRGIRALGNAWRGLAKSTGRSAAKLQTQTQ